MPMEFEQQWWFINVTIVTNRIGQRVIKGLRLIMSRVSTQCPRGGRSRPGEAFPPPRYDLPTVSPQPCTAYS